MTVSVSSFRLPLIGLLLSGLALSSCASPNSRFQPFNRATDLRPVPVSPVQSRQLPPVTANSPDYGVPSGTSVTPTGPRAYEPPAVVGQSANAGDLQAIPTLPGAGNAVAGSSNVTVSTSKVFDTRDVLGAWNVASGDSQCTLNLSLTTWSGGFRASTRQCEKPDFVRIGAWNLNGKQLLLSDTTGAVVARLFPSGDNRFDGKIDGTGIPVSVYR